MDGNIYNAQIGIGGMHTLSRLQSESYDASSRQQAIKGNLTKQQEPERLLIASVKKKMCT